jgi:hypothetical protein
VLFCYQIYFACAWRHFFIFIWKSAPPSEGRWEFLNQFNLNNVACRVNAGQAAAIDLIHADFPLVVGLRRTPTLTQLPPRQSANYIPPRQSVASRVRRHGTTGWPISSHGQGCNLRLLSITKITLALAPNSSILNQPHPPPLILAASRCPANCTAAIYAAAAARPSAVTDELTPSKNKIISSMRMAW